METPIDTALQTLLQAGVLAPSGDNTQPWKFRVEPNAGSITLDTDPARDPSPMNVTQIMSRLSLGCVLENMARTANHNGWPFQIEDASPTGIARFILQGTSSEATIPPLLYERSTNRRVYDGRPLEPQAVETLAAHLAKFGEAKVTFITDQDERSELIRLIGRADAIMLGTKPIRDAFLAKVRFDASRSARVEEGLSLGSLQVGTIDRLALRTLQSLPIPDRLLRIFGARGKFAAIATKLASSASGFCVISHPTRGDQSDLEAGRAWQDLWLALTDAGMQAQPMMSLVVLKNICNNASHLLTDADRAQANALVEQFESAFCQGTAARVLMRFGTAPPPTDRVARLAPDQFCAE